MEKTEKYYECLGLLPGASPEKVKKAYRTMVKAWHPDRFRLDPALRELAHEKLKEINEAYRKLRTLEGGEGTSIKVTQDLENRITSRSNERRFRAEYVYPGGGIGMKRCSKDSRLWFWCLIPIVGLPILMLFKRKDDLSISSTSAKILILLCFLLYAASFLIEAIVIGRGVQSTIYWLIAIVYIAMKSRVVIKTNKEVLAFITQLNVLISVLFIFWTTKGILFLS
jgi:hypothetical protein